MAQALRQLAVALCATGLAAGAAAAQPPPASSSASAPRDTPAPATAAVWSSVLSGQVVDAATGRGVPRASLELRGGRPAGDAGEMSDDEGMFVFRGLPPGRYSLEATKTGYNNARAPESRLGRRVEPLEIGPGQTRDKIILSMVRASAITGRVVDQFGEPAPNTRIWLRHVPNARRRANVVGSSRMYATTNDIGEFRLAPIGPGSYLLVAVSGSDGDAFRPKRTETGGFVAWPAASSLDDAQPLIVEVGQTVSDVELKLYPLQPVRVTGTVLLPDGRPADGASLTIGQMLPGDHGASGGSGTAVQNGVFSIALLPGTYEFRAKSREGDPVESSYGTQIRPRATATQHVTVSETPLENVVIQLAPPRRISGRLVFDGSGRMPPPPMKTARVNVAYVQSRCEFSSSTVNDDGAFSLYASGDRCFVAAGVTGWQVRSLQHAGREVLFEGLSLTDERPLDDLVITLTDRVSKLSATVSNAKGLPAEEFVVVAFPADKARRPTRMTAIPGLSHRLYRAAGPSPSGRTTLDGLFAGEYLIAAFDTSDLGEVPEPDAEWFERLEPVAQRITIKDGDVRTINLKIVEAPPDTSSLR
jgi:hypothetical protein